MEVDYLCITKQYQIVVYKLFSGLCGVKPHVSVFLSIITQGLWHAVLADHRPMM
jgi:hypothetical protein